MNNSKKNIWILGGTGFIGKALVAQLADNPQYLLNLLVHKNIPFKTLEHFNTFIGSLEDFDLDWMQKYPPDILFHLARLGGGNALTRSLAAKRGARANARLIKFLTELKKTPVVVYVSGSLMYGHQTLSNGADESAAISPVAFARYYIEGEKPWMEAQQKKILDIRFARPGWIVGDNSWFRVYYWNYYLQTGKIPMYGDGQTLMSLVHVYDCAGQIINLAENGTTCQNFNIFSSNPVSQKEFSETLARLLDASIENIPIKKMIGKYGKTVAEAFTSSIPLRTSCSELVNEYVPKYGQVDEMLLNTISVFKNQKSVLTETP
jgi:nucleoside-diphosphate-sugar epimerase